MNFADMIFEGKEPTCADVAAEIVKLDTQIPKLEENKRRAVEGSVNLRKQKLAGKEIPEVTIKAAESNALSHNHDAEAARQSLKDLNAKLIEVAKEERQITTTEIWKLEGEKRKEAGQKKIELIKEVASIAVRWRETLGPVTGGIRGFEYMPHTGTEDHKRFRAEIERLTDEDFSRNLVFQVEELNKQHRGIAEMSPEQFGAQILAEVRAQTG